MVNRIVCYVLLVGFFGFLIWFVLDKGKNLSVLKSKAVAITKDDARQTQKADASFKSEWEQRFHHPISLFLFQIIIILIITRLFGRVAKIFRQPTVVGEIIAGICLGPSLLGWVWPGSTAWLFPPQSLSGLVFINQFGLVFFMFIVGMEVDISHIKYKAKDAIMISHASIIFPFFLGVWLAYFLYPQFAPPAGNFLSFALFLGIAMSITAFPVLARIIQERKLTGTPLGNLATICAATDDISAWLILAIVVAIVKAESLGVALINFGFLLIFLTVMIYIVKPLLAARIKQYNNIGNRPAVVLLIFTVVLLSAWIAEILGVHALFGAFLAGVIMPSNTEVKEIIRGKVGDVSMLLLPLFFAFTGLRTQINLIAEQQLLFIWFLVMLVAVAGKFAGSALTARLMGQSWPDSLSIGALMNTRGLMELVVLNVGYELGVLSAEIFTILVLMALATTFMTNPLLDAIDRFKTRSIGRKLHSKVI